MNIAARLNRRITQMAVGRALPRRTVRVRLTLLYGGLFLLSGAALVATTYALFERATEYSTPHLPKSLTLPPSRPPAATVPHRRGPPQRAPRLLARLAQDQYQLAQDRHDCTGRASAAQDPPADRLCLGWRRTSISWHRISISWHRPSSAGSGRASDRPGRVRRSRTARRRLAPASGRLGDRSGHRGRARPSLPAGSLPAGCCDPSGPSPARPSGSLPPVCTSAWPSTARRTSSRNSGTPSMTCSGDSTLRSKRNASSSPTRHTSSARR